MGIQLGWQRSLFDKMAHVHQQHMHFSQNGGAIDVSNVNNKTLLKRHSEESEDDSDRERKPKHRLVRSSQQRGKVKPILSSGDEHNIL